MSFLKRSPRGIFFLWNFSHKYNERSSLFQEYVECLRYRLGMKNMFTISVHGKGGGLALFWDDLYTLELNKFGEHFIDMYISSGYGTKWRSTFVYGEP